MSGHDMTPMVGPTCREHSLEDSDTSAVVVPKRYVNDNKYVY